LLIVLKQHRGMGGAGVRRIEAADVQLRTQHAESGSAPEVMSPDEFFDRCKLHFPTRAQWSSSCSSIASRTE
jgi:hypothetical protein